MTARSFTWLAAAVLGASLTLGAAPAENDLDAFMKQVVARRDDNWKKLQQYVFDEREQLEMRGPNRVAIWGERREYTWYIRDGFFVRSPTKFNGVTIGDAERRTFEAAYPEAGAGAGQARSARRQRDARWIRRGRRQRRRGRRVGPS